MLRLAAFLLAGIVPAGDGAARDLRSSPAAAALAGVPTPPDAPPESSDASDSSESSESSDSSEASGLPDCPTRLYAKLSEATRPQWRLQYRETVTRCLGDRNQAALGLGAVAADLYLAVQARDGQQVRNLLQDAGMIEKTLGLAEVMARERQQIIVAAEQQDWPLLTIRIRELVDASRVQFAAQKDESLADLAYIGQWLRALQICHTVTVSKRLNPSLAGGSHALIGELRRRLQSRSDSEEEASRTLRVLHSRLASLEKLWRDDVPAIELTGRLHRSAALLDEIVARLIQDESPDSR